MSRLAAIASRTIPKPNYTRWRQPGWDTEHIINAVMNSERDPSATAETRNFAPHLKEASLYETLQNLWKVVRGHPYKVDPDGEQYVQNPAAYWHMAEPTRDCKSMSRFMASCLANLRIPYYYRFTATNPGTDVHHVYIRVPAKPEHITLDACMPGFNQEDRYATKIDKPMAKIYRVTGVGQRNPTVLDIGDADNLDNLNSGVLDLMILKQRMEIRKAQAVKLRGIGSKTTQKFDDTLDMINDALDAAQQPDVKKNLSIISVNAYDGYYTTGATIRGIGLRFKSKQERKEKRQERRENLKDKIQDFKGKTGTLLKNVANKIENGVKAVTKVVTAPGRLVVKGILELSLPAAAPAFLYLFIDDATAKKLSAKVQAKRSKQAKIADFIVNKIGMQRNHLMGILRNGIIKRYGKNPEDVIAGMMRNKQIAGIGVVADVAMAVKALVGIINKLRELFGKDSQEPMVSEGDAPEGSDFDGMSMTEVSEYSSSIVDSGDTGYDDQDQAPNSDDEGGNGGGRRGWSSFGGN